MFSCLKHPQYHPPFSKKVTSHLSEWKINHHTALNRVCFLFPNTGNHARLHLRRQLGLRGPCTSSWTVLKSTPKIHLFIPGLHSPLSLPLSSHVSLACQGKLGDLAGPPGPAELLQLPEIIFRQFFSRFFEICPGMQGLLEWLFFKFEIILLLFIYYPGKLRVKIQE